MRAYPGYSTACTDPVGQDQASTTHPSPDHATITVSGSGLAPGVVYQIAVTARSRVGYRILERVSLALPHTQPVTLRLSSLPSPVPTALPSSGQALVGQLPTVEGVEARIDIP